MDSLEDIFSAGDYDLDIVIPYSDGNLLNRIHKEAKIISEKYEADGVHITAKAPLALYRYISERDEEEKMPAPV